MYSDRFGHCVIKLCHNYVITYPEPKPHPVPLPRRSKKVPKMFYKATKEAVIEGSPAPPPRHDIAKKVSPKMFYRAIKEAVDEVVVDRGYGEWFMYYVALHEHLHLTSRGVEGGGGVGLNLACETIYMHSCCRKHSKQLAKSVYVHASVV